MGRAVRRASWALPSLIGLLSLPRPAALEARQDKPPRLQLDARQDAVSLSHSVSGVRRLAFQALHQISRGELAQPKVIVFMAGLPGAGKSTIVTKRYRPNRRHSSTAVLDLDAEMREHPDYDPADPDKTGFFKRAYRWADKRIEDRFRSALADSSLRRIVLDGTGTNAERQRRRMRAAREAGWFVKILYVDLPLETAVRRAALRARPVSASRIYHYQTKIGKALVETASECDEFETFDAPSHDPAHVLLREGYVDQTRTLARAEAEAKRQAEAAHSRAVVAGKHVR